MAEEARLRKVAEETPGRAIPSHEHGLAFCATEREREREREMERERENAGLRFTLRASA